MTWIDTLFTEVLSVRALKAMRCDDLLLHLPSIEIMPFKQAIPWTNRNLYWLFANQFCHVCVVRLASMSVSLLKPGPLSEWCNTIGQNGGWSESWISVQTPAPRAFFVPDERSDAVYSVLLGTTEPFTGRI